MRWTCPTGRLDFADSEPGIIAIRPFAFLINSFSNENALHSLSLMSGGKDPIETDFDAIFQCLERITRHIKRAMASHFQWTCLLDQFTASFFIDGSIGIQYSQHNTISTQLLTLGNVALHRVEFIAGVAEVFCHADGSSQRDPYSRLPNNFYRTERWCGSTFSWTGTKFNAVCSCFLCAQGGFNIVNDNFYFHQNLLFPSNKLFPDASCTA